MDRVHPQVITKEPRELTQDILAATNTAGPRYKLALLVFGGFAVAGVVAFIVHAMDKGFDHFGPWGYMMAAWAFLLTTASSAPLVSVTQRMVRSHWRRPLARASELFGVVGILSTLMFIPLILLLPAAGTAETRASLELGRRSIWFEFPGAPLATDLLAVGFLSLLGVALLWTAALPDMASARQRATGLRKAILDRLVFIRWTGTDRQWAVQRGALTVMGALYFLFLIYVHTVIAADFGEALVPSWKDAVFPAHQAITGLQSAVASTVLALFLMYKLGGYKDYIAVDQFWGASKLLLPLTLMWFYFWFSGFIIYWYGRQPGEQNILKTFMFQAYSVPFYLAFFLSFLTPFLILIWNSVRKSMAGPAIVSVLILTGAMFDKIRIYVASFNIADQFPEALKQVHPEPLNRVPNPVLPGAADMLIIIGAVSGGIFLYLLAMKVIPAVSIWEVREGMLYRRTRKFLKTHIMVMGKPD